MGFLTIYLSITIIISLLIFYILSKQKNIETSKYKILKFVSLITVFLHYSSLWVDFFKNGEAMIGKEQLLPIYPCHIIMWTLVIIAFYKNKESKIYKILTEFAFYAGTVCAIIGIILNENFLEANGVYDYGVIKGLLSHSTLLFGTLMLFVFRFFKVSVINNTVNTVIGLLLLIVDGLIINFLFWMFELEAVNAMYLLNPPFENLPFINVFTIGAAGVLVVFIISSILEIIMYDKTERTLKILRGGIK